MVVGVGSVVDRSNGKVDFGVPLHAFLSMEVESFEEADCPLCKQGLPITSPAAAILQNSPTGDTHKNGESLSAWAESFLRFYAL